MIIHAKDYILRNFVIDDVDMFYSLMHYDDTIKEYVPSAYPRDYDEAFMLVNLYSKGDSKNDFYLIIEKNGIMIGVIIAVRVIGKCLDTSGIIFKPYRGKGVMTIVLNQFIEWLKNNTEYETLSMAVRNDNVASLKQIQKCGAVLNNDNGTYKFFKIYLKGNSTMAFNKSRNQCVVIEGGKWVKVTNNHVGKDVYDKKTNEKIGTLVERNHNTNMLQLKLLDGKIVTIR